MPNQAAKVAVGKPMATGGAYWAPLGTALPVDVATALAVDFLSTGYVSSDGVTQTVSQDTTDIVAWGGDTVRKVSTTHDVTFALTLIETNAVSNGIYYGRGNVTTVPATALSGELTTIEVKANESEHGVWIFELADGNRRGRIILPDGQVSERGEIAYQDESAVSYGLTISAYPDADGVKAYIYWNDGIKLTP